MGAKVINANGSFATKEVAALLAELGKHLSDGGEKFGSSQETVEGLRAIA
jgi:hypothetical protein